MNTLKLFQSALLLSVWTLACTPQVMGAAAAEQGEHPRFRSAIFKYDDPVNAKGLHVLLRGTAISKHGEKTEWVAKDGAVADIPFYQKLFATPEIMKSFGEGKLFSDAETTVAVSRWSDLFRNGFPLGGLTVFDVRKGIPIGFVKGTARDPGVAELGYSYIPDSWGNGVGSSVIGKIINEWAPEVRRWGLGTGLDERQDMPIVKAFQCFGGKRLERVDATASPANVGSWRILDRHGFKAAVSHLNTEREIDFEWGEYGGTAEQQVLALEKDLEKLYVGDTPLTSGVRYALTDPNGNERTFSLSSSYNRIKFHFEHTVEAKKDLASAQPLPVAEALKDLSLKARFDREVEP